MPAVLRPLIMLLVACLVLATTFAFANEQQRKSYLQKGMEDGDNKH